MSDPTQNQNSSVVQQVTDVPPMPDFPSTTTTTTTTTNTPPPTSNFFPPSGASSPKKKFGSKKIIATFLGVLLLIAGVATGIVLILQPQLLEQQASVVDYSLAPVCPVGGPSCPSGLTCNTTTRFCVNTQTDDNNCGAIGFVCPGGKSCRQGACASTINCGGTQCAPKNCHCTGGDACTGYECYSDTQIANYCTGVGRSWCTNYQGNGMTCCEPGYTCGTSNGCFKTSSTPKPPNVTPKPPVVTPRPTPTRSPSPTPTRSPSPTPTRSPSPTPTRSPSPTPTRSPSPTPVPQCNSNCTASSQCPTGMTCSTGKCRKTSCTGSANCICPTPTPTKSPSPSPTPTRSPSPTPTTPPTPGPNAVCSGILAYDSAWNKLSNAQLSTLKAGNNIQFCVAGTSSSGLFDKGKFTINTVVQAETTTKRPNSNDLCQAYTIPANVFTFNITAQIHHVTLGWVGP